MKQTHLKYLKSVYENPSVDVILLSSKDVVSTSGPIDDNQGDWDPQSYSNGSAY